MSEQLYPNGFRLAKSPYVKIRTVFLDIGTTVASFNIQLASTAIKQSWMFYLNASAITTQAISLEDVEISMIDQNVFYNLK